MAGVIRITELDLHPDVMHISTDYQISTDELFGTILAESIDDRKHLTDIVFNIVLDPEIKYYARARVRLSTGYTAWGNVDMFTPENINDIALNLDLPTLVGIPIITLDEPNDNFPLSLFNISVSGFAVNSSSKHVSTTYIIETIDGDLVWSSKFNEYYRDSIFVDNILLKKNEVYRIKAMFHTSSGDVSQLSTVTVKTMDNETIQLNEPLISLDVNVDNNLHLLHIPNMSSSTLNIYATIDNTSVKVFEYISQDDPTLLHIPIGTLLPDVNYFITITVDIVENTMYDIFSTY